MRRYEAVQTQPTLDVAARIAAALAITLDQLAGDGSRHVGLSGTWWLCRRGEPGAGGPQHLSVRQAPAPAQCAPPRPLWAAGTLNCAPSSRR